MSFRDEEESVGNTLSINKEGSPPIHQDHQAPPISKVITSGTENEYIHIGNTRVLRSELVGAFGGDLFPSYHTAPSRKFANPVPLGLCGFAMSVFVLSLYNVQARGVTTPNVVAPLCFFYGGAVQLISGIWCIVIENTFGATALASYGGFWISYGAILTPAFGVSAAYEDPEEFQQAIGLFLMGWFVFTSLMCWSTVRSTVAFFGMFVCVAMTFLTLGIGSFTGSVGCTKAGGWFGLIAAALAWYNAMGGVFTKENSYVNVRPLLMPGAAAPEPEK